MHAGLTQSNQTNEQVSHLDSADWRVDYLISSSSVAKLNVPSVQLCLAISNPSTDPSTEKGEKGAADIVSFDVADSKFQLLLADLRAAREMMDTIE